MKAVNVHNLKRKLDRLARTSDLRGARILCWRLHDLYRARYSGAVADIRVYCYQILLACDAAESVTLALIDAEAGDESRARARMVMASRVLGTLGASAACFPHHDVRRLPHLSAVDRGGV